MNPLEPNKEPEIVTNETSSTVEKATTIAQDEVEAIVTTETVPAVEVSSENESVAEVPAAAEEAATEDIVASDPVAESKQTNNYTLFSKAELVNALKNLVIEDLDNVREDIELIKQIFYRKLNIEQEENRRQYLENGGDEAEYIVAKDDSEEELKVILNEYKQKKAARSAQIEKEKENNLLQKQHILEQMKKLVESNDDVVGHISEFKALQNKWKTIGPVSAQIATDIWKQYSNYQEAFWDLIKINNELREYDFKKNLEAKTFLCEAAEKLADEEDVVSAFQQLQKLHEEWHDLGPVSRELREEIWNRFKAASTVVNKKHQTHFESIRKLEDENQEKKNALCDLMEAFVYNDLKTYKAWEDATQTIIGWQDEWRAIGFAPRKVNQKFYERYRKVCDDFFSAKAAFYKEIKNQFTQNYDKKKKLCEQAEALKDSTEWKETAEKLIQLQKEWKITGPVSRKVSDDLWKRFVTACDYFFEQKGKNQNSQKSVEVENMAKKKAIIDQINALNNEGGNTNDTHAKLRGLMAEWNEVGHVPFKEKDKLYKEYRTAVDKQFESLNIDSSQRRLDNFKTNLKDMSTKGENKLYREREKLVRAYEHLKSEIATYENNIGFFTTSSKKGGGLIKEMERKIEALKEECRLIEQKINMIEENM
jgi:hypothetical protein